MGSVLPQYHCFLKLLTKSFLNVLCEKPVILVELLLELRIVVIQDSEVNLKMAKGLFAKNALGK